MGGRGKRGGSKTQDIDTSRTYSVLEAVSVLKKAGPRAKFDESVDLAFKLGIDPKQADQIVRGAFSLPNGTGKDVRVVAFCEGEAVEEALAAGAMEAGSEELIKKVQDGWTDFDVAIAHPQMMRLVSRLGRVLGKLGKMPSPKSGTVSADVAGTVQAFKAGRLEYRTDSFANLHVPVGRMSFPEEKIVENIETFVAHIASVKPAASKGTFLRSVTVSTTMGPGLKLAV